MPPVEEITRHERNALLAEKRASAVSASHKHEQTCLAIENTLGPLLSEIVTWYEDFRIWQAKLDAGYAARPEYFDAESHNVIEEIERAYHNAFDFIVSLLDQLDRSKYDVEIPNASKVRDHYSTMLSIQLMDHGPMPSHIAAQANAAMKAFNAGEVQELEQER